MLTAINPGAPVIINYPFKPRHLSLAGFAKITFFGDEYQYTLNKYTKRVIKTNKRIFYNNKK